MDVEGHDGAVIDVGNVSGIEREVLAEGQRVEDDRGA